MAAFVVALPELAQGVLTPYIPNLEIHVCKTDRGDILADCWDGALGGWRVLGEVYGFDGAEEGGFAGVVEAEEEDGVFCVRGGLAVLGSENQGM